MIEGIFGAIFRGFWTLIKLLFKFLRNHPRYAFLLPFILVAAYLRFSYIFSSLGFLSIDPQDIHLVQGLFGGNLLLLGRLISPANITLGPFYNYLIILPLWVFGANPLGPALVAGLLNLASVYLLYIIGKQFFNLQAGIFAAGLYAVSSFVISYVSLSWNMDVLPFFSILLLWVIFNAAASARPIVYYISTGYLLGLCLQLHYVALFLVPLVFFYMLITEIIVKGKMFIEAFLVHFLEVFIGFFISFLFFFCSEFFKGFVNTKALITYLALTAHTMTLSNLLFSIPQTFLMFFARLIVNFPSPDTSVYFSSGAITLLSYFGIFLFLVSFFMLFFARNRFVVLILLLWLISGAVSLSFFTKDIYDYHFSLLYPVCFLLVGNFFATIFHFADQERVKMVKQLISQTSEGETYTMIPVDSTDKKKLWLHRGSIGISVLFFFFIILLNLLPLPYHYISQEKTTQISDIASSIIQKAGKKPLNFALLTTPITASDQSAYMTALTKLGDKPVQIQHPQIDPQRKTVTGSLYVACEDISCKPLESSLWSIKGFGKAAIIDHWTIDNVLVYKLVPTIER